jgi:hypothetical protein
MRGGRRYLFRGREVWRLWGWFWRRLWGIKVIPSINFLKSSTNKNQSNHNLLLPHQTHPRPRSRRRPNHKLQNHHRLGLRSPLANLLQRRRHHLRKRRRPHAPSLLQLRRFRRPHQLYRLSIWQGRRAGG